jgi:YbbR domain-containing protein
VSSSGIHTLNLQAKKKNTGEDYTIVNVSPSTINVMLDVHEEAVFDVEVDCVGATVAELKTENQSLLLEPTFVDEMSSKITVSGPESEIRRIAYIRAVAPVNKELSETENFTAGIVAYDDKNTVIHDANNGISTLRYVDFSYATAEISANVNLRKVVPLTYDVEGAPANRPSITLLEITGSEINADNEVKTIGIKGAKDVISLIDEIKLDGTVDFTQIDLSNPASSRFELKLPAVAGVTYDEYANLTDLYFVASVDSARLSSCSFDVAAEDVVVKNLPKGLKITVQSALKGVTVVGPADTIRWLTAEDIQVTVDALSVTSSGASNLTPVITVNNGRCWAVGTYQVVVEATAK